MPQRIGKNRIIGHTATGGFGDVYKGYDGILNQNVAIKVPRKAKLDASAKMEFINEARAMARMEHPNIVSIKEAECDENGFVYLVLKWIDGQTLAQKQHDERLSVNDAVDIVAKIAVAIGYAHDQGFIHRDLKPSNVLIDENGEPLVTDFGLAIGVEHKQLEGYKRTAGTLPYMSPEQCNSAEKAIDHRTDVWSLGVIFYQLLTGRRPFEGSAKQISDSIRSQSPKPIRQFSEKLPKRYETACLKCLEKDPSLRWQTAKQFAASIDRKADRARRQMHRLITGSVSAVLIIGVLVAWLTFELFSSPPPERPKTNLVNGVVEKVIWPDGSKLDVKKDRIDISASDLCFARLGTIADESEIEISIKQDQWDKVGFVFGFNGHSCLLLLIQKSVPSRPNEFLISRYQYEFDLEKGFYNRSHLGDKYVKRPIDEQKYKLKIYFQEHRLKTYRFGIPHNRNVKSSESIFEIPDYGPDSKDGDVMTGWQIKTTGGFGLFVPKGQSAQFVDLKVDGKKIDFKSN